MCTKALHRLYLQIKLSWFHQINLLSSAECVQTNRLHWKTQLQTNPCPLPKSPPKRNGRKQAWHWTGHLQRTHSCTPTRAQLHSSAKKQLLFLLPKLFQHVWKTALLQWHSRHFIHPKCLFGSILKTSEVFFLSLHFFLFLQHILLWKEVRNYREPGNWFFFPIFPVNTKFNHFPPTLYVPSLTWYRELSVFP